MSELIYHSTPIRGTPYKKGDWKKVATHNDKEIKGFFGPDYFFLSCWYPAKVIFDGIEYPSAENSYQAQKVDRANRKDFANFTPEESKKYWKEYTLEDKCAADWDARKADVMLKVVSAKFAQNSNLRKKLLDTGDKYLEETNWHRDCFFGVDIEQGGQNVLGKILMQVRESLRDLDAAAARRDKYIESEKYCVCDDFKYGYGRQND